MNQKAMISLAVNKVEQLEGITKNILSIIDSDLSESEKLIEIKKQVESYEK